VIFFISNCYFGILERLYLRQKMLWCGLVKDSNFGFFRWYWVSWKLL